MQVHYRLANQPEMLTVPDEADLHEMATAIEQELRERHPELAEQSTLPVTVADGLLNTLADDQAELSLGDVDQTG